jgi:hypothetical protein
MSGEPPAVDSTEVADSPQLGERPAVDEVAVSVALSRLKDRLFGKEEAVKLGRYQLLEIVGSGGMGVVWGAWDPELDRRVAIKLVKPSMAAARERMLVEGQALAKLSHPNVVPVYDVGTFEDQVYLVMEWVRGASLRVFALKARTTAEIVAVYRQAGEGLAAAHAAGLVHRDFKPENAIRGDDGRVRVLDFGLARNETVATGLAGTPKYMAPEQRSDGTVTAAADQYAFCVSLREALTTKRSAPVPRWIDAILARGTQEDPAARYPAMTELLRDLARDPAVIRRRWAIGAGALAAVAGAFAIGTAIPDEVERCSGGERELAPAWSATSRDAVAAHLASLGGFAAAQVQQITARVDRYAADWIGAHKQACEAHERGTLAPAQYAGRVGCLARSKAALAAASELLASATVKSLDGALVALDGLPEASRCADHDASLVLPPPAANAARVAAAEAAIARARVFAEAAHADAVAVSEVAAAQAAAIGYAPTHARALLVQGLAAMTTNGADAVSPLGLAVRLAIESGDDVTAVEAFARHVFMSPGSAVDGRALIEAIARRSGPPGRAARALLYNNLGANQLTRGDRDAARALFVTARGELPDDPSEIDSELVCIDQNLALVAATDAEREAALAAAADLLARRLGASHSRTLLARVTLGVATANGPRARDQLASVCRDYERDQPHLGAAIAWCEYELAWTAQALGDADAARVAMQRAAEDPDGERNLGKFARAYLADAREAVTAIVALGDELARSSAAWEQLDAGDAYAAAGVAYDRLGDAASATRVWAAAVTAYERADLPFFRRRLVNARAALARQLATSDPRRAHALAELAREWYATAGGYEAVAATLPP